MAERGGEGRGEKGPISFQPKSRKGKRKGKLGAAIPPHGVVGGGKKKKTGRYHPPCEEKRKETVSIPADNEKGLGGGS